MKPARRSPSAPRAPHAKNSAKKTTQRARRVESVLRADLADLVTREMPAHAGLLSIREVEISDDGSIAKIFFSVLGGDAEQCQNALNRMAAQWHSKLFRHWHMQRMPRLNFVFDPSEERAEHLQRLMRATHTAAPAE